MPNQGEPLVSVKVVTYNHAAYISRCIESILNAENHFPIRISDWSKTAVQIGAYAKLCWSNASKGNPDIIRVVTSESNVGMRANSSTYILPICQGEYIAFCDGDD